MSTEYEAARAEAAARREARYAESRARVLLSRVGWSAAEAEMQAELESHVGTDSSGKKHTVRAAKHAAVIQAAVELQAHERSRERRLSAQEVRKMSTRNNVPAPKREKIKDRVAQMMAAMPNRDPDAVRRTIEEEFGVVISWQNFRLTYWPKDLPAPVRTTPTPRRAPAITAAAPRTPRSGHAVVTLRAEIVRGAPRVEMVGDVAGFLNLIGAKAVTT